MPLNQRMDKENVVHFTIEYHSAIKKQWHHEICMQMGGARKKHP